MQARLLQRHIAVPQDHGAWVFILSPLLIGLFAGGSLNYDSINIIVASIAAFMLRQPVTILVKIMAHRRTAEERTAALVWFGVYLTLCLISLSALILDGVGSVILLAVPGAAIFAWHLWLVSRREERQQAGVEIVATGALSLAAPAAYWIGMGRYDPSGWWLWIFVWMQSASSIVYTYLRLEQRKLDDLPSMNARWMIGTRAAMYTTFNLAASLILGLFHFLPVSIFLPYLLQWFETIWGIFRPAIGWKPMRIGLRQLIVSALWTVLFILIWR